MTSLIVGLAMLSVGPLVCAGPWLADQWDKKWGMA